MLGGSRDEIINAVSHAWVDGQSLRTYRHAPNTGSRKSWAAGDATSRAVRLALIAMNGEMGYPSVLTRQDLGLLRRAVQGQRVQVPAPLRLLRDGERAVQDLLPGRVPCADRGGSAMQLHPAGEGSAGPRSRRSSSARTKSAIRIIDKKGPLNNPADRDHCIQYMVAVPLIFGRLTAADYEDDVAADPRIDALRDKMVCVEDKQFTQDYLDPEKRSIANALTVEFKDGTKTEGSRGRVPDRPPPPPQGRHAGAGREVHDQPGPRASRPSRRRRSSSCATTPERLEATPVNEFVDLFVI